MSKSYERQDHMATGYSQGLVLDDIVCEYKRNLFQNKNKINIKVFK